jgi:hypothetical protein
MNAAQSSVRRRSRAQQRVTTLADYATSLNKQYEIYLITAYPSMNPFVAQVITQVITFQDFAANPRSAANSLASMGLPSKCLVRSSVLL